MKNIIIGAAAAAGFIVLTCAAASGQTIRLTPEQAASVVAQAVERARYAPPHTHAAAGSGQRSAGSALAAGGLAGAVAGAWWLAVEDTTGTAQWSLGDDGNTAAKTVIAVGLAAAAAGTVLVVTAPRYTVRAHGTGFSVEW